MNLLLKICQVSAGSNAANSRSCFDLSSNETHGSLLAGARLNIRATCECNPSTLRVTTRTSVCQFLFQTCLYRQMFKVESNQNQKQSMYLVPGDQLER